MLRFVLPNRAVCAMADTCTCINIYVTGMCLLCLGNRRACWQMSSSLAWCKHRRRAVGSLLDHR